MERQPVTVDMSFDKRKTESSSSLGVVRGFKGATRVLEVNNFTSVLDMDSTTK